MRNKLILTLLLATAPVYAAPIAIKATSSDPGLKVKIDTKQNAVTLRGTAKGPEIVGDPAVPRYEIARGVGLTLDIDKAPTTDAFGKTDYTLKNRRLFGVDTSRGWSAREVADRFAVKVNARPDFSAKVVHHDNGASTIHFAKR